MMCKGVVTEWPDSVLEFWDAISDRTEILKLERMYKKKWDKISKKLIEEDTGNIIVSIKGNKIKERIGLFDDKIFVKVKPYVFPVKQCFNCFKFGHIKTLCKSKERCIICGQSAHGKCDLPAKCVNCEGDHRSTNQLCTIYERNRSINIIMAYHNVSFRSAERILFGRESEPVHVYDGYVQPDKWPKLQLKSYKSSVIELGKRKRMKKLSNKEFTEKSKPIQRIC